MRDDPGDLHDPGHGSRRLWVGRGWLFQVDVQNTPEGSALFEFLGRATVLGVPMLIVAFLVLAAIVWIALRWTRFGRFVYAMGDNPAAARIAGLPVRPMIVAEHVITSLIAYAAGLVMAATASGMSTRVYNSTMIYDVLLVVVLGGIGLSGGRAASATSWSAPCWSACCSTA